jgi:hypothetical protein
LPDGRRAELIDLAVAVLIAIRPQERGDLGTEKKFLRFAVQKNPGRLNVLAGHRSVSNMVGPGPARPNDAPSSPANSFRI